MQRITNQITYLVIAAVALTILHLLANILVPFIFALLLAYLMNPLVLRLEKYRFPHLSSVIIVFTLTFSIFLFIVLMLIPLLNGQINALLDVLPKILLWLQTSLLPRLQEIINFDTLQKSLSGSMPKITDIMSVVTSSSHMLIAWAINLILIPVVTFYLLRDWETIGHNIKSILPKSRKTMILKLTHQFDEVLSAFFQGQLLVMVSVFIIYASGLTLVGLKVGFIIGLIGGLLSIVPYLGSMFVLTTATVYALIQFGTLESLISVWVVYLVGQFLEGWVLTPYLVGHRIGLHPVIIIFAIMAGGALFGFFGVLVALPAAALIKALLQFSRAEYSKASA